MKPSEICKAAGLKNLKELSTIAKVSSETLVNWSKNRPDVFRLLIAGVVAESNQNSIVGECEIEGVFSVGGRLAACSDHGAGNKCHRAGLCVYKRTV